MMRRGMSDKGPCSPGIMREMDGQRLGIAHIMSSHFPLKDHHVSDLVQRLRSQTATEDDVDRAVLWALERRRQQERGDEDEEWWEIMGALHHTETGAGVRAMERGPELLEAVIRKRQTEQEGGEGPGRKAALDLPCQEIIVPRLLRSRHATQADVVRICKVVDWNVHTLVRCLRTDEMELGGEFWGTALGHLDDEELETFLLQGLEGRREAETIRENEDLGRRIIKCAPDERLDTLLPARTPDEEEVVLRAMCERKTRGRIVAQVINDPEQTPWLEAILLRRRLFLLEHEDARVRAAAIERLGMARAVNTSERKGQERKSRERGHNL